MRPLLALLVVVVSAGAAGLAGAQTPAADDGLLSAPPQYTPKPTNCAQIAAGWWFSGYRASISKVRGPVCNFEPSCSHYSQEAIKEFGLLRGLVMTGDRLQRCHQCLESRFYPRGMQRTAGGASLADPVSDHDLWWWWTGHHKTPESGWLSAP